MVNNECSFGEKRSRYFDNTVYKAKGYIQKQGNENNIKYLQKLITLQNKKYREVFSFNREMERKCPNWETPGKMGRLDRPDDYLFMYGRTQRFYCLFRRSFVHTASCYCVVLMIFV